MTSDGSSNLLHKLQDAIGRGQDPAAVLPSSGELEVVTISQPEVCLEGEMWLPIISLRSMRFIVLNALGV